MSEAYTTYAMIFSVCHDFICDIFRFIHSGFFTYNTPILHLVRRGTADTTHNTRPSIKVYRTALLKYGHGQGPSLIALMNSTV